MASRRVYITLNDEKERDKVIIDYLSQSYSESDAIKEAIYRLATNSTQTVQKVIKGNTKVEKDTKSNNKVKKVPKSNKKVTKDTNNTVSIQSIPIGNIKGENDDVLLNLDDISEDSCKEVQKEKVQDDELLRQNEINQLKEFMI